MKKRIMSILLCICMVFTLLPVTAMAAGNTLTVAGTNVVNGSNVTYWLCNTDGSITSTGASESNYNVKYDPATTTLTLNNANIASTTGNAINDSNYLNSLTVVLIGANTITTNVSETTGIHCDRALTITAEDEASLTVSGTQYGLYVSATLKLGGKANVIATGNTHAVHHNHFYKLFHLHDTHSQQLMHCYSS